MICISRHFFYEIKQFFKYFNIYFFTLIITIYIYIYKCEIHYELTKSKLRTQVGFYYSLLERKLVGVLKSYMIVNNFQRELKI